MSGKFTTYRNGMLPRCRRCGGSVLRSYDEFSCIQCGAPYYIENDEPVSTLGEDKSPTCEAKAPMPDCLSTG